MFEFKQSSLSDIEWDQTLQRFHDHHVFQSAGYAKFFQFKHPLFRTERFLLFDGKEIVALGQLLIREIKLLSLAIITIKAGPIYRLIPDDSVNAGHLKIFLEKLLSEYQKRYRHYYCYLQINTPDNEQEKQILSELDWCKVTPDSAALTAILKIEDNLAVNFSNLDKKWRNQLRRAQDNNLRYHSLQTIDNSKRFLELNREMCQLKKRGDLRITATDLSSYQLHFPDNFMIHLVTCDEITIAGCAVLFFGEKAYYLYAAANQQGRALYASNFMIWELIKFLKTRSLKYLDLMGLDPYDNFGTYHFKMGIGGQPVKNLGKWNYASDQLTASLVTASLWLKRFLG